MDKTAGVAVCYLSTSKRPSSMSEYVKSRKLNRMQTLLASLGITVRNVYVDEGFEQTSADKPGLKKIVDQLPKKEFGVFVTESIYDLSDNFSECIEILQYLIAHHIRVICLDNHIDSAMNA